jgi:phosphoribosylformylglycinamidine synthase
VQIGDPITQKKMLDMLVEARDCLLYRAITDNGAGGLSSSVGEMARLSGGARLELDRAPLKYPGLDPWEILLSEAQERMTLAVPPESLEELLDLARRRDVLAVPMGEFTGTGYFHVLHRERTVAWLPLEFLHADIPLRLRAVWDPPRVGETPPALPSVDQALRELVSDLNACSREPLIRRYDHEVGGGTVVKPLVGPGEQGPSDAGVIAPVPGSRRGFVLSADIKPFYSRVDTIHMAAHAVDEAVRNAVAAGADPDRIALLDNFCWPDPVHDPVKTPDGEHKLAQLVLAARGLREAAVAYGAPFISGKDSMKNDYKVGEHKVSVLPTVLVSALGLVPDIARCVTSDFKAPGHPVYLLGATGTALGESLLYRRYGGVSGCIPVVRPEEHMALYRVYFGLAREGLLASGHDLSEGGLALALAESCIGGGMGARVDLAGMREARGLTPVEALFAEDPGRLLVSVLPEREGRFLELVAGLPCCRLGETDGSGALRLFDGEAALASAPVSELSDRYRDPLYRLLGMERGDGTDGAPAPGQAPDGADGREGCGHG